jgi:predicted small metal-binding protein
MREFRCGEIVPGCDEAFQGETDDEILERVEVHAREEHGMDRVPPEVADTIRASITEV